MNDVKQVYESKFEYYVLSFPSKGIPNLFDFNLFESILQLYE